MDPELIAYLDRRFDEAADRVDRRFDEAAERVDHQFAEAAERVDHRFAEAADRVDRRFDAAADRVDRRFVGVDQSLREIHILLEAMDVKIETVAEGVLANSEAIRASRSEMDRQFDEVKAVNRLSYAELDRRLREHDRRLGDLEAR